MMEELQRCINQGGLSKRQRMWSLLHPSLGLRPKTENLRKPCKAPRQELRVAAYQGNNPHVIGLRKYLQQYLGWALHAAVVHGSLATDDEVNYSDFDALIVLKDEVLQNKRQLRIASRHLCAALCFLRKQDLLQHHGWMLLSECDLLSYDPNFLPLETLECGRSLLGDEVQYLEIAMTNGVGSTGFLEHLCESILNKLEQSQLKQSAYFLKAVLSELMLVPAVTYQAQFSKGLYKRESFDLMKPHYEAEEWKAIETASAIRALWPKYTSLGLSMINNFNPILASHLSKKKDWAIDAAILQKLDEDFVAQVKSFLEKSKQLARS